MKAASNKYSVWFLGIIILAVVLRIGAAIYLGNELLGQQQTRIMDQVSYNALAKSLLEGRGYSFEQRWYPFTAADAPTAHWSFLYPIFLALVYTIFGPIPLAARLVQAVISGVLSAWLLYSLGKRLFGHTAGLTAAGLGAIYIYFIYHDAALMTESFFSLGILGSFILALELAKSGRDEENRSRTIRLWIMLGAVLGVTAVLRQTVLLWVPFLLVWILFAGGKKGYWKGALSAVGVMILFILPWTIRNYIVYEAFLPLNSNAGYALYTSNHPDHGIHFVQDYVVRIPPELREQNEAQLNSALIQRGLGFILEDPQRYLLLSLSRVPIFFNFWFSSESNLSSNLMRVLSYGVYLPFFVYGLILARRSWRESSLFYLFILVYSAIHILTWASIRYRLVIDATLMPFAALAVMDLVNRLEIKSRLSALRTGTSSKRFTTH